MTATDPSSPRQPVDPGIEAALEGLPALTFDANTLPEMRKMLATLAPADPPDDIEISEYQIDPDAGTMLRVLRATKPVAGPLPCVYWMHGGGFVIGNRMMDDIRLIDWVRGLGCVAVSVEYRLAPDNPYPAPLDDCYAGLAWVHEHAPELGVDLTRVGVGGLSAGGGLAAGLALLARDRAEFELSFQLLDSPMLDDRQNTPSSRARDLVLWSHESNRFGWESYLGALYDGESIPAYAAPSRSSDLAGLPPTLMTVGSVDGFRDEDIDYATRLNQAGVPTELHVYPGAPHGFSVFGGLPVAQQAALDAARWLGAQFSVGT